MNGGVSDGFKISMVEANISTSPVGIFKLTVPSGRALTRQRGFEGRFVERQFTHGHIVFLRGLGVELQAVRA